MSTLMATCRSILTTEGTAPGAVADLAEQVQRNATTRLADLRREVAYLRDLQRTAGQVRGICTALAGETDGCVRCPYCGGEYVAPVSVAVTPPGNERGELRINADGIHRDATIQPVGRGVAIVVQYVGECGHGWKETLRFCKGQTLRTVDRLPDGEGGEAIWRD